MIKVAVLMSTYNGEKYLKEQIDSILGQRGNFEISLYVRDDGSSDKTIDILEEYQKRGMLQFYQGDNVGPARSFLLMVQKHRDYDFYSFADQDDVWDCDKLQEALNMMHGNASELYTCNVRTIDQNNSIIESALFKTQKEKGYKAIVLNGNFLGCTMVFNQQLAKMIQQAELPNHVIMHDNYVACLCVLADGTIYYDNLPHMSYRLHGNNMVGAGKNFWQKISSRMKSFLKKRKVSIAFQSRELMKIYFSAINSEKREFLECIAGYQTNWRNKWKLIMDEDIRYDSTKYRIYTIIKLLFGTL